MKPALFVLFCLPFITLAQNNNYATIIEAQIISPDSIPIENAYLVSYKTLRAFATDENGKFSIITTANDSIKIEHLSFATKVIYANQTPKNGIITLEHKQNKIGEVSVIHNKNAKKNMESNMNTMILQIKKELYMNCQRDSIRNPYKHQFNSEENYVGIDFIKLYKLIQHKRKQKK